MPTPTVVVALIALLLAAGVGLLWARQRRLELRIARFGAELEQARSTVGALCSGAAGIDKRLHRIERRERELEQRQESIERRQRSERPYDDAIRLVQDGVEAGELVERLGLSRNEANLIVMLHRGETAG